MRSIESNSSKPAGKWAGLGAAPVAWPRSGQTRIAMGETQGERLRECVTPAGSNVFFPLNRGLAATAIRVLSLRDNWRQFQGAPSATGAGSLGYPRKKWRQPNLKFRLRVALKSEAQNPIRPCYCQPQSGNQFAPVYRKHSLLACSQPSSWPLLRQRNGRFRSIRTIRTIFSGAANRPCSSRPESIMARC